MRSPLELMLPLITHPGCAHAEAQHATATAIMLVRTMVRIPGFSRSFAPPKGGERPAALTPQRGLAKLTAPEELRCAAGPLLVAETPAWDLLLRAKHLFVAAMVCLSCGVTWVNEGGLRCRRPHRR